MPRKISKVRPSAKNKVPEALRRNQVSRTRSVVAKLDQAFTLIEQELAANEGIYPHNQGRLSQAEVCRRAGINPMTLYGERHQESKRGQESTKNKVDSWLKSIRGEAVQGKKNVRRAVTDRADRWKAHLDALGHQYHLAELEKIDLIRELGLIQSRCKDLEEENEQLRIQLSEGRVTPIRGRR